MISNHANKRTQRKFACTLAMIGLAGATVALAQAPLPDSSPFLPNSAAAKSESGETLELAGVSTVGDRTDLIFHDKNSKKNSWVRLGSTADGITALKYDSRLEQAVVRVNGVEKVLTLRKGTGPLNAPMPPPPVAITAPPPVPAPQNPAALGAPVAGAATPATAPDAVAHQETEARMLVSDLLEIGMAQRKAYEEAQRKAAAANGAATGAPAQPPAVPPVPGPAGDPAASTVTQPMPVAAPPAPPPQNPPPPAAGQN